MKAAPTFAFKNTSNAFYIVPLILALKEQLLLTALLVSAVVVFGLLYHLSREKKFGLPDMLSA